jgi:glycine oxidase
LKHFSEIDFLIVGQGLAGSAVAMRALALDYKVLVIDQPFQNHSSRVAAGLFNPITGRKMVKTWLDQEVFSVLHQYYNEVERLTRTRFYYPMPLYRPFSDIEEQNEWMVRSMDPLYETYISSLSTSPRFQEKIKDPFGGITLKQTGYVDTNAYLKAVRHYLQQRAAFEVNTFDAAGLKLMRGHIEYEGLKARRVIFCQGVENARNPWFRHLPLNSLKGELLTVQSDLEKNVILNRGVFMVPGAIGGEWRVGSTYDRNDKSLQCTAQARTELVQKLEALINIPFTITGQDWGVRPVTPDRKPILGMHPEHKSLIIFNGLGTKGVSLAPYFSAVLIRWMENKGTISKEADVTRFN